MPRLIKDKKPPRLGLKFGFSRRWINLGSDPELFITDASDQIISSDKLIPEEGIDVIVESETEKNGSGFLSKHCAGKIVRDGVQVELHPIQQTCRQIHAVAIALLLKELQSLALRKDYRVSLNTTVDVNLSQMPPEALQLGCQSSLNYYDSEAKVRVNGSDYPTRSAGGHIHIGLPTDYKADPASLVPLLDIVAGNLGVLFDSDPRAAERRLNYGRAGEFRLPAHGLEYRTLSNFWLNSYPLMGLFFGLVKQVVLLAHETESSKTDYAHRLVDCVKRDNIIRAINTADKQLALENFAKVIPFVKDFLGDGTGPLNYYTVDRFYDMLADWSTNSQQVLKANWYAVDQWTAYPNKLKLDGWEKFFADTVVVHQKEENVA